MPQPGVIIEWYGHYSRAEIGEAAGAEAGRCLGMALRGGEYRYVTSWNGDEPEAAAEAAARLLEAPDNQQFYIGQIVSFNPGAGLQAAKWALIRALHPELNEHPEESPPNGNHYCVTVFSTFYVCDKTTEDWRLVEPPAGFPTLVLFNSYGQAEEPLVEMRLWQTQFPQIR